MENRLAHSYSTGESLISTHKVLRNTYMLLAMTLTFSAVVAFVAIQMNAPAMPWWGLLVGFYGLLFLTNATSNSSAGILSVFALTGFLGYTLGPILKPLHRCGFRGYCRPCIRCNRIGFLRLFSLCINHQKRYELYQRNDGCPVCGIISRYYCQYLLSNSGIKFSPKQLVCHFLKRCDFTGNQQHYSRWRNQLHSCNR